MRVKIPWDRPQPGRFSIEQWEIDPLRTALLVIDMQMGYVDSTSRIGRMLRQRFPDIYRYYYPRLEQTVLPNILQLRDFFQSHALQMVYIRAGLQLPGGRDLPPWSWRAAQVGQPESLFLANDGPEYELVPQLAPLPHDLVLDVNSVSPFASTSLDQLLRNMGVENLVVTGVLTNAAVESTVTDAGDRGYNAILVEDGCAAYRQEEHEDTLANARWWVVKTTDEVMGTFGELL